MRCCALDCVKVCGSMCEREILENVANGLQFVVACCSMLQCVRERDTRVCCSVLQCVAVCVSERYLNALQSVAGYCVLRCSMYGKETTDMSQCVAVSCRVLQCAAVRVCSRICEGETP